MNLFAVSFFGHREVDDPFVIEQQLEAIVRELLHSKEYVKFLVVAYLRSIRLRYRQGHHPVFFNDFLMDWLKRMKPRVAVTTYANYEIVLTRRR